MKKLIAAIAVTVFAFNAQAADLGSPGVQWTGGYIEGSLGTQSSTIELGGAIKPGDTGYLVGVGLGYDFQVHQQWLLGALVRYDISDISYTVGGVQMADASNGWMIGGRVGFIPTGDWMLYGLAGYRWSKLDFSIPGISDQSRGGLVAGGGMEASLGKMFIGIEGTGTFYQDESIPAGAIPVSLESIDYQARVRVGYKF